MRGGGGAGRGRGCDIVLYVSLHCVILWCAQFKGEVWYWLEVENGQDLPDSLMSARLKHDTFDGQRSSHIAQHSQLLAVGEQLLSDLVGYETMITVSETDSTSSVSHVQQVMTDLRAFLPGMEEAMDQLKLKLEKCVELQNLKKAGHEVCGLSGACIQAWVGCARKER